MPKNFKSICQGAQIHANINFCIFVSSNLTYEVNFSTVNLCRKSLYAQNIMYKFLCFVIINTTKDSYFLNSIDAFFKSEKKLGWNLSFILQWLVKKAHCFFHVLSHISAQTYIMYVDILVRKLDCETRHSAYWSFAKNLNFRRCFCFSQFFFWVLAFLNDGKNASFSLFVKGGRWRLFCFWSISLIYV